MLGTGYQNHWGVRCRQGIMIPPLQATLASLVRFGEQVLGCFKYSGVMLQEEMENTFFSNEQFVGIYFTHHFQRRIHCDILQRS